MEFLLKYSSLSCMMLLGLNYYKYKELEKYNNLIKQSIQIDLSYERLDPKLLENKDILLCTSIDSIIDNNEEKDYLNVKEVIENEHDRKFHYKYKIPSNLSISLMNNDNNKLLLSNNTNVECFDLTSLKVEEINQTLLKQKNSTKFLKKLSFRRKVTKGISKNSRVLVYGNLIQKNNISMIKPKFIIGSGLVEFEEIIEYLKM